MTLKRISTRQKAQLRSLAKGGDALAVEALNSIDNEIGFNGTSTDLTLYVETTGNDTNPGTALFPCATVNGALAKIGDSKKVKHLVNIKVGIGTFPGFNIEGFTIDPNVPGAAHGIAILGTYVAPTLVSGTASGTITSTTAGSNSLATFAVVTDTGQNWVVDALKGMLVEILTGTSTGTIVVIASNTATTFTAVFNTTLGSIGGTYAIRDWGTVISCNTLLSPAQPVAQGTPGAPSSAGAIIQNNSPQQQIRIEALKILNSSTGYGLLIQNSSAVVSRCFIGNPGAQVAGSRHCIFQSGIVGAFVTNCYIRQINTGAPALSLSSVPGPGSSVNNCLIQHAGGSVTAGVGPGGPGLLTFGGCQIENFQTGLLATYAGSRTTVFGSKFVSCSTAISVSLGTSPIAGSQIDATGLDISSCTTAISIVGPSFGSFTTLKLTSCTNGVVVSIGGRCQVGSASTFTTVTNELTIDGAVSTLAAMRAASPKLVANTYGTIIHE